MADAQLGNVRNITDVRLSQGDTAQKLTSPAHYADISALKSALKLNELQASALTTVASDGGTSKHFNATDGSKLTATHVYDIYEVGTLTKRATVTVTNISTNDITYSETDVNFVAGDVIVPTGWTQSAFSTANLDTMTVNDLVYALRQYEDEAGIL